MQTTVASPLVIVSAFHLEHPAVEGARIKCARCSHVEAFGFDASDKQKCSEAVDRVTRECGPNHKRIPLSAVADFIKQP